jgi:fatty acid desaturase
MSRNRGGDLFALAAALFAIVAAAALMQGGALGWALTIVAGIGAVTFGGLAWLGWTAPRDDDEGDNQ